MRRIPEPRRSALAFLLLGSIWLGCAQPAADRAGVREDSGTAARVDVLVVSPAHQDIARQIELPVSIEAYETATLLSKVSGYLSKIEVDIGDTVRKGQVLAKVAVPEIEAELEQAEAELASKRADHASAEAELERATAALEIREITFERTKAVRREEEDVMSQQALDEAEAQFKLAQAEVKAGKSRLLQIQGQQQRVRADMKRLGALIEYSTIRAPFDGAVTRRYVHPGALLQAATSSETVQRIVTVATIDRIRVRFDVPEAEVPYLEVGDAAVITVDALPNRRFEAAVTRFAAALDPATRTLRTEVEMAPRGPAHTTGNVRQSHPHARSGRSRNHHPGPRHSHRGVVHVRLLCRRRHRPTRQCRRCGGRRRDGGGDQGAGRRRAARRVGPGTAFRRQPGQRGSPRAGGSALTRLMRAWALLWVGLCAAGESAAGEPQPLSLDLAVNAALANHPSLLQAALDVEAAQVRSRLARSARLPQADLGGLAKRGLSGSANMFALNGLAASPDPEDIAVSGNVLQDLLDFRRSKFETEARRAEVEHFEETLRAEEASRVLAVTKAYYLGLAARQREDLARRAVRASRLAVRRAESRLRAGLGSRLESWEAKDEAGRAELERTKAVEHRKGAQARLAEAMGTPAGKLYALVEPEALDPAPASLHVSLGEAVEARPELAAVDARVRALEWWLGRAKREKYPRVMAMFSGGWTRFAERTLSQLLFGGFGIQLPLFTGGRLEAGIDQARIALEKTRAVREALVRAVEVQVVEARSSLASARESLRRAEIAVERAGLAERFAHARHRNQLGDLVELESARTALATAETQRRQAIYDREVASAQLAFATGASYVK